MKKIFRKEFLIGFSVITAIVILCIGIEFLKGINVFKPANFYIARYHNVNGLETAAPVTVDGYKVGQVREINFNYENPGQIEVVLALNNNLRIPVDSKATISSTLLSGAYVEINLGTSHDMIAIGGDIQTEVKPDLMASLGDDLMPSINSIVPRVDSLLVSLNRLAGDPALLKSIQSLEGITSHIYAASDGLDALMNRQMPGIVGNIGTVTDNLDSISRNLNALSMELKALPLASTMDNVEGITSNLNKFTLQLNDKNSTLGKLTTDPELYERIARLTADVDSLVNDIQKNPKRYISIKLL